MAFRPKKLSAQLMKIIAEFLRREFGASPLVTATDCLVSEDARSARVRVAVFPEKEEKAVLLALKKKRRELNRYLAAHVRIKYLPSILFEIDRGEKNRRRIDELLKE